ncbi:hypothetical protein FACS1894139_03850 [Planctomycetales bacterium]|nr:hypothetical protein FACS1894139_03850 [Planctomycetales bacterium]
MNKFLMAAVWCGLVLMTTVGAADAGAAVREEVGKVYTQYLNAMKAKNLGEVIDTLHSQSPAFNQAKQAAAQNMVSYDLTYNITAFEVVGVTKDGAFAVVRAKLETRKAGGAAPFEDNELDALQVFSKDGGKWKIWGSVILGVKPMNN